MSFRPVSSPDAVATYIVARRTLVRAAAAAFALGAGLHSLTAKAAPGDAGDKGDKSRLDKSRAWFTDSLLVDQHGPRHRFYSDLLAPFCD